MNNNVKLHKFVTTTIRECWLNEIQNSNKRKSRLITESEFQGKTIISVDIQPEYVNYISFNLNEWVNLINQNASLNDVVFLYNGADTLGMIDENSYKEWLVDLGIEENVVYNSTFYDKGYAFFRYCIDSNISQESIVNLVKFMVKNNINDSRELSAKFWNKFVAEHQQDDDGSGEIRGLLENASDMINIPDLMDFLKKYSNIVLLGGGINECLKEVEIALMSLDKNYKIFSKFVY